jgi:Transposase DDE domain
MGCVLSRHFPDAAHRNSIGRGCREDRNVKRLSSPAPALAPLVRSAVCRVPRARRTGLCSSRTDMRCSTYRFHYYSSPTYGQQVACEHQTTAAWQAQYAVQAGIEGTLSQGIREFALRQSRYLGIAQTHLQHGATAAAMNLVRVDAWFEGSLHARTRLSRFAALHFNVASQLTGEKLRRD